MSRKAAAKNALHLSVALIPDFFPAPKKRSSLLCLKLWIVPQAVTSHVATGNRSTHNVELEGRLLCMWSDSGVVVGPGGDKPGWRASYRTRIRLSNLAGNAMVTLRTTIPDDLSRQVRAIARARGIPVQLLVEEALRSIVSPEPFTGESEALAEMEASEADVLRDAPWER